jgi:hypothetical protein
MKSSVETGDSGSTGEEPCHGVECLQRLWLVQRSQIAQVTKLLTHLSVDEDRFGEGRSSVHYAVADRVDH